MWISEVVCTSYTVSLMFFRHTVEVCRITGTNILTGLAGEVTMNLLAGQAEWSIVYSYLCVCYSLAHTLSFPTLSTTQLCF